VQVGKGFLEVHRNGLEQRSRKIGLMLRLG
jgi:hypothetical protein